jgi:2-oxoisovalerate dehydrogenase E1 component alpha subunit
MANSIAHFDIQHTQFLDTQGLLTQPLPEWAEDKNALLELYRNMVLARVFDTKAIALQRTGKMGTYAPIHGQEAIGTAIGHAMHSEDVFIPYYRDYATQIQRKVKMSEIYNYWGGDERGSCFANNKEDLPLCVPIATQCLHAAGVAFAFKYRNQPRVAVTVIGDGGTSEGDFYEALNVAGAWNLPVVFVVNNNQWAISVPLSKQTAVETIAQKAIAAGFTGEQVDGNDIIAMREMMGRAIEKARNGGGPTLIEAMSYRLCDHTTADDAGRYQPKEEVEAAKPNEPFIRFKKFLMEKNYWDEAQETALLEDCAKKVQDAVEEYVNTPMPAIEGIFDFHYAELPEYMIEQRAQASEEYADAVKNGTVGAHHA